MFGSVLRAGMVLIAGSLLYVGFRWAMTPFTDALADVGPEQSTNVAYLEMTATWLPLLVVAAVAILLLSGAAARRGRI